jgi:hypothetical protein
MPSCHLLIRSLCYWFLRARLPARDRRGHAWAALFPAVAVWFLMCPVEVSAADVILLKNGDRVSGDIITMEDTVLKVDTDYADVIYIDWEDVAGLTSHKPLWVSFHEKCGYSSWNRSP